MTVVRAVHVNKNHTINRGDCMEPKYAEMYCYGKAIIHVVAPSPMTQKELDKRIRDFYSAAWDMWNSLSIEDQIQLNAEAEASN